MKTGKIFGEATAARCVTQTAVLLLFVCILLLKIILTWISDALFVSKSTKDTVFLSRSLCAKFSRIRVLLQACAAHPKTALGYPAAGSRCVWMTFTEYSKLLCGIEAN